MENSGIEKNREYVLFSRIGNQKGSMESGTLLKPSQTPTMELFCENI